MKINLTLLFLFFCGAITSQNELNWKRKAAQTQMTLQEVETAFWQDYSFLSDEEKERELQSFNRFRYIWFNRVQNNITGSDELSLYKNVLDGFLESGMNCEEDASTWNLVGPTAFTTMEMGRVTAIWADSEEPNIIICASDEGSGIWRTTDAGENWECVTDYLKLPGLGIIDIVNKPGNNDILIASCGNSNLLRNSYSPGLLISLDKGQSWQILGSFENDFNELVNDFAFSELDSDIMYAVSDHHFFKYDFSLDPDPVNFPNQSAWIKKEILVGTESLTSDPDIFFTDIEVLTSIANTDILFVSSKVSGTVGLENYAQIIKSYDYGVSWTDDTQNLGSFNRDRIADGAFDNYNQLTLSFNQWNDYLWKHYSVNSNNVAGCYGPYDAFEINTGNRIGFQEGVGNLLVDADYELCFDYHNAENCAFKIMISLVSQDDSNFEFQYALFNSGMIESQGTEICLNLEGWFDVVYQYYFDYLSSTQTAEDIEFHALNDKWKLWITSEAIAPYAYNEDADYSDLTWVDNVVFIKTSPEFPDRIQLSTSDENLYVFSGVSSDSFIGHTFDRYNNTDGIFEFLKTTNTYDEDLGGVFYKSIFEASPDEPCVLIFGGKDMSKYVISSESFEIIPIGGNDLHVDMRDAYFTKTEEGIKFYLGTDGGPALSNDLGESWNSLLGYGLAITQFYGFGMSSTGREYLGGTLDNSLSCGSNGESYIISNSDGGRVAMRPELVSNPTLYSWRNYQVKEIEYIDGVFVTGQDINLPINIGQYLDREIVLHPTEERVFTGKDHLYYYEPSFPNNYFVPIQVPGSQELINGERPYRNDFNSIAISETNPSVMYIADEGPCWLATTDDIRLKVFKTEDGGQNWLDLTSSEVDDQAPGQNLLRRAYKGLGIRDILVSPINPDHLWVCFPGVCITDNQGNSTERVLRSLDGGISWTDISAGLPPLPMHCMAYQRNANNRVYIGTDVGVYYMDDYSGGWQCFSSTLPACVVTGIQIDECRGKIYCCTFGRGIWESDLLPANEIHITTEVVWTENKMLDGGIVIEPGGSLEIVNSSVTMPGNSRIYVDLDAELILNQAILQPSECNARWKGIELGGANDLYQLTSQQGKVTAFNNSVIKRAKIGVSNINSDDGASSGGIALLEEVSFEDCPIGVKLHDYPAYGMYNEFGDVPNNLSTISKCTFSWGPETYNYSFEKIPARDSYPIGVFLSMVKGIQVKGNLFQNLVADPIIPIEKLKGTGIYVNTASMKCHAIEEDDGNGGVDLIYNQFSGLTKGIYAVTCDPLFTTSIDRSRFNQCWRSVSLEGQFSPRVTRCEFDIPYGWEYLASQVPYGLYLKECQYYEVEDNLFNTDVVSDYVFQVGIVVKDSYDEDDQQASNYTIYRNDFTNLKIGISVEGENRSAIGNNGLQIKCNRFFQTTGLNDERCISLSKPGTSIAPFQGAATNDLAPAGNLFSPAQNEYNFFINQGAIPLDIYWHHNPSPLNKVVPFPASNGVNPENSQFFYFYDEVCPTDLSVLVQSPTENISELNQHYSNFREIKNIYDGIVDKGNQQTLISFIRDPLNTSIEVRNEMLSSLPNSDAALREAMYRTGGMNPWHMSQVLIANSPLKTTIINYMQQSGLDIFYQELVLGQQNGGVSNKSILEADMDYYTSLLTSTKSDIFRSYVIGDGLFTTAVFDSLLTDSTDVILRRVELSNLIFEDPLSNELDVLENCTSGNSIDNYCKVQNILLKLHLDGRSMSQIDQIEVEELESVVEDDMSGSATAEAILEMYKGEIKEEEVAWPSQSRGIEMLAGSNLNVAGQNDILSIYPNPTNDIAYFVLNGDIEFDHMNITITDMNNRVVKEYLNMSGETAILETSLKEFGPGVYTVQLGWDGHQIYTQKLVVVK